MVLALQLKADLQGVTNLKPIDTEAEPFYYTFKVQCTSCRETHANWVGVSRHESNEQSGSRGEANFVWRCKNCKREHSASIKSAPTLKYEAGSPPKAQKILEMDCRGLEFTDYKADGPFEAVSNLEGSSTRFAPIDLSEGEWYDYDEKAGEEVSIKDIAWEIVRA